MTEIKEENRQVGHLLQTARKMKQVTQQEMSAKIGLGKNHISALERGVSKQPINMLLGYCRVLHMSPNDVLQWDSDKLEINPNLLGLISKMNDDQQKKLIEIIKLMQ